MPTEIVFGAGVSNTVDTHCRRLGSKALVVTGRTSAKTSGALERVLGRLADAVVFDAVEENPTSAACEEAAAFCRKHGCDHIVAIGGGSPMDAAKAIAVLARNDGICADYYGGDKYPNAPLPVVAIPTTAGTGSEVTPYAVLVDSVENTKRTIAGQALFPVVALLDPELTVTMPRAVTVNTGLDALSQAMEGMVSLRATPMTDTLAMEAVHLIARWLPRAADHPKDLEARAYMLYASMLSGCVIAQTGTTLVHGMGYYFTVEFGVPHGLANALLLAPVFQYNAAHAPVTIAALARALGETLEDAADTNSIRRAIGRAVHRVLCSVGVDPAAHRAGVVEARLPWCASHIRADASRFKNQLGHPTEDEVHRMFQMACTGALDQ